MALEVELKFAIFDLAALRDRLLAIGAKPQSEVTQSDAYYNHPSRDFAQTDEALRIRSVGEGACITYKGPKIGVAAKTRYELEVPVATATEQGYRELLERLGFRSVATVEKVRKEYTLSREEREFSLTIDTVSGLGNFLEVETLASESSRPVAEQAVTRLAADLGLTQREMRSYLEMLLATQGES